MFSKNYHSLSEYNHRLENFKHTAEMLHDLDEYLTEHGHNTQRVAHNAYSDWTDEERAEFLTYGLATGLYNDEVQGYHYAHLETEQLEHRIDWVERGAVSHVRTDGSCAASWANAAASAIEGAYFIKHNQLPELSAQQFIDCDHQSYGCHGGLFTNAFDHA